MKKLKLRLNLEEASYKLYCMGTSAVWSFPYPITGPKKRMYLNCILVVFKGFAMNMDIDESNCTFKVEIM